MQCKHSCLRNACPKTQYELKGLCRQRHLPGGSNRPSLIALSRRKKMTMKTAEHTRCRLIVRLRRMCLEFDETPAAQI